jgi:hypothetical protein
MQPDVRRQGWRTLIHSDSGVTIFHGEVNMIIDGPLGWVPIQSSAYGVPSLISSSSNPSAASSATRESAPVFPQAYVLTWHFMASRRSINGRWLNGEPRPSSSSQLRATERTGGSAAGMDRGARLPWAALCGAMDAADPPPHVCWTGGALNLTVQTREPSSSSSVWMDINLAEPSAGMSSCASCDPKKPTMPALPVGDFDLKTL